MTKDDGTTTAVISQKLIDAYDRAMTEIEAAAGERATQEKRYWWNLYLIRRDELWKARFTTMKDWLGEFSKQPFGESVATYYGVMGTIERMLREGVKSRTVQTYLGNRKTALEGDMKAWFEDGGRGPLKPAIQLQLEAKGETLDTLVRRVAVELPPGQAREEIGSYIPKEKFYATDDPAVVNPRTGELMFNIVWESAKGGIQWKGTLRIKGTRLAGNKKVEDNVLPEDVAGWLMSKFGVAEAKPVEEHANGKVPA